MKSFKELLEEFNNDEAFVAKFNEMATEKAKGVENPDAYELVASTAAELGYEVNREEWEEFSSAQKEVLTEEELGKVSGGLSPVIVWVTVVTYTTEMATMVSVAVTKATSK